MIPKTFNVLRFCSNIRSQLLSNFIIMIITAWLNIAHGYSNLLSWNLYFLILWFWKRKERNHFTKRWVERLRQSLQLRNVYRIITMSNVSFWKQQTTSDTHLEMRHKTLKEVISFKWAIYIVQVSINLLCETIEDTSFKSNYPIMPASTRFYWM